MINQMYSRIELRFWDWAIPVLSHSPRIQKFLRQLRPYANQNVARKIGLQVLIIATGGFSFGILASLIIR
jgi:predicted regulator of amino acid metabolism with ACT domain